MNGKRRSLFAATLAALGVVLALGADDASSKELSGDAPRAAKLRALTYELSSAETLKQLAGASETDQLIAVEKARALLYEGRCAESAAILSRPDLAESDEVAAMGDVSRGCERSVAGAVVVENEEAGSWIRFQDGLDVALAPLLNQVVKESREIFKKDLGVEMPRPIRIEVVRDQFGLSAMTGLPLSAARTTGTIGIAKWGRVVVVSPRATSKGYPILDTIAHELTHLALSRGSGDNAPLWLQEGVAKELETQWREPTPFDDVPPADDVALFGIRKKIGPEIHKIGPSIALLPSAIEAEITYAKVHSFMRFYAREAGDGAMPKLLSELKTADAGTKIDDLIEKSSGATFTAWSEKWKGHLERSGKELPEDLKPGAAPPKEMKEARRRFRLGELMAGRGHHAAAVKELDRAQTLLPRDASTRALLAKSLLRMGEKEKAAKLVAEAGDVATSDARWWSIRAALGIGEPQKAIRVATGLAPYDPDVTCEEKDPPDLPEDPIQRAVCQAARERPRSR
ncbi:MAG: tetratricopeptide repeat protein [Polyangiaceae bacterium]|nr:tetratricopeptide repeat protein [Polyangiaceae bacterium]